MRADPIVLGSAHYFHWGVVQISLANLIVIASMIVVFALALVIPFPRPHASGKDARITRQGGEPDDRV